MGFACIRGREWTQVKDNKVQKKKIKKKHIKKKLNK